MKKQTILSAFLVLVIFVLLSLIIFGSKNKKDSQGDSNDSLKNANLVLYYGNTCSHCRELEEWLKKNQIEKKLKIEKKEVYKNKENAKEMLEAAKTCQIDSQNLGVPFLFTKNKCFLGTEEIIKYLKRYL